MLFINKSCSYHSPGAPVWMPPSWKVEYGAVKAGCGPECHFKVVRSCQQLHRGGGGGLKKGTKEKIGKTKGNPQNI